MLLHIHPPCCESDVEAGRDYSSCFNISSGQSRDGGDWSAVGCHPCQYVSRTVPLSRSFDGELIDDLHFQPIRASKPFLRSEGNSPLRSSKPSPRED